MCKYLSFTYHRNSCSSICWDYFLHELYHSIHALGRAIKLRQRFSNWFEITRPDDHKSNSAHRYFVNVLEKIADLFLQAAGKTVTNSKISPPRDAISGASRAEKQ